MPDKNAIAEQWLDRVLRTYPPATAQFLAAEEDPFRNPVGHAYRQAFASLVDELLIEMNSERVTKALEFIVQIRAIQDFTPAQALGFVFQLKDILRSQFHGADLDMLASRVDEMALVAFDLYVKYRERTFQARAEEARRRVYVLERALEPRESNAWHKRSGG